jgi:hypothetical protein
MADGICSPSSAIGSYGEWPILRLRMDKRGDASLLLFKKILRRVGRQLMISPWNIPRTEI